MLVCFVQGFFLLMMYVSDNATTAVLGHHMAVFIGEQRHVRDLFEY